MLVQFGNDWIKKIPLTAKLDSACGLVQFWLSSEFFSSNYFQIGQHVVLLHILMIMIIIIVITIGYYCFIISTKLCVTGAWAGAGYGWRGSWLVVGRAGFWGALATWVGVGSSSPQVPEHPRL